MRRTVAGLSLLRARTIEFRHTLDPVARRRNARYLRAHAVSVPVPPERLLVQVAGSADAEWFLASGIHAVESIRAAVADRGRRVEDLAAILDFGCGCGRVIRHWPPLTAAELHGVDYSSRLVDWCRANLPHGRFSVNQLAPPLGYPAQSFDLIYALSVFTHLPEPLQHAWITEFSRLLTPDGLLLLTVHGMHYRDQLSDAERRVFDRGELVVRNSTIAGTNLCTTFHPPEYVRRALPGPLRLVEHLPVAASGNPYQDIVLLEQRAVANGASGALQS
jgi:SAM-dependent methyltransferase